MSDASEVAAALRSWAADLDTRSTPSAPDTVPLAGVAAAQRSIMLQLGYLPATGSLGEAEVTARRDQLLADAAEAGLLDTDDAAPPEADSDLFDRLAQALELRADAGLGLPVPGEVSLRSRILQAQLAVLGARQRPAGRPVDQDDDRDLILLAEWLEPPGTQFGATLLRECGQGGRETALTPIALLASDADALIGRLLDRDPSGYLVASRPVFVGIQLATEDVYTNPSGIQTTIGDFIDDGTFASLRDTPRPLLLREFEGNEREMLRDGGNRLGLRLVQVKLKRRGVYTGAVDGIYGDGTWNALAEVAKIMQPDNPAEAIMPAIRVLPSGRQVALSFRMIIERALSKSEPGAAQLQAALMTQSSDELAAGLGNVLKSEQTPAAAVPAPHPEPFSLFRSLRDLAHRVFEVVTQGLHKIAEFVADLLQPLRDLLAWIRAMARRLLALLDAGLAPIGHLILGEPFGSGMAISKVWIDRDMMTIAVGPDALAAQVATFRHDTRVLDWAGRILVVVVRLILAAVSGPLGWLQLARMLLAEVPDLLGSVAGT